MQPGEPGRAERRQAARDRTYMFTLTKRFRRDIQRLYIYNFFGDDCAGAASTPASSAATARARPAYDAVKRQLQNFKR